MWFQETEVVYVVALNSNVCEADSNVLIIYVYIGRAFFSWASLTQLSKSGKAVIVCLLIW
jgi:hypothetical protein